MAERAAGPEPGDAFGQALLDLTAGRTGSVIIERDNGFVTAESLDYLNAPGGPDLWALDRAAGGSFDSALLLATKPFTLHNVHYRRLITARKRGLRRGAAAACPSIRLETPRFEAGPGGGKRGS